MTSNLCCLREVGKPWVVGFCDFEMMIKLLDLVIYYALLMMTNVAKLGTLPEKADARTQHGTCKGKTSSSHVAEYAKH